MKEPSTQPIILLAFANDRDDRVFARYLRNLPKEARRLQQALEPAEREGLCRVKMRQNAMVGDILKLFQSSEFRNQIAIFHFGGHASSYQLLFETPEGKPAAADAAWLASFLSHQTGLQLVFLNGCSTQQQAQGLLEAGVSAVIATSQAIHDEVATEFSACFYQALAGGAAIGTAFREAEAAVQTVLGGAGPNLYAFADEGELLVDGSPWNLYLRDGAEEATDWNLPEAVDRPLFGLPPLPELDLPESPYRHLKVYRREDAEVFFGRGYKIRELYERVTAPRRAPILLFYGQSGVGKSSLLAAGLLPRLEREHAIRFARREQALGLLVSLARALDAGESGDIAAAWQATEEREGKPLVVVLDQVEEVYTRPNDDMPDELDVFLGGLRVVFGDPEQRPEGMLILGFRKEWLAELEKAMAEHKLPRAKVLLKQLTEQDIKEVVTGPASSRRLGEQYGLKVAEGLPVQIAVDLLADPGSAVAPMLAILLSKMWEKAQDRDYDQPSFDKDLYIELKHEGLGLGDFLDQQLDVLHADQPEVVDSGLALDLLAFHTTPQGTAEQRSMADLEKMYCHEEERLPDLVQKCQDLRLLVDPSENQPHGPATSRLAHDTLAPLVRVRFDESDRLGQRARRILESRAMEWKREGWDGPAIEDMTLDPIDLAVVEEGAGGMRARSRAEERLVSASRRERERKQRNRRVLRATLIGLGILVVIGAILAVWQWQTAERRQAEAEELARISLSRQLAAQATSQMDGRLDLAFLLGAQAYHIDPNLEARSSLFDAHTRVPVLTTYLESARGIRHVLSVSFSPAGDVLAEATWDGTINLWDIASRRLLYPPLTAHPALVDLLAFTPDGKRLASAGGDTVRLWDVASGRPLGAPISVTGLAVKMLAFSPDGNTMASLDVDGGVLLWDIASTPPVSRTLDVTLGLPWALAFSADGSRLLLDVGGVVHSYNVTTLQPQPQVQIGWEDFWASIPYEWGVSAGSTEVVREALSPDGRALAMVWSITGGSSIVSLWDTKTGSQIGELLHDQPQPTTALAFSPDGKALASLGRDNTIVVWNTANGHTIGEAITVPGTWARHLAVASTGKVAVSTIEGDLMVLDLTAGRTRGSTWYYPDEPIFMGFRSFSPDARLAVANYQVGSDDYAQFGLVQDIEHGRSVGVPFPSTWGTEFDTASGILAGISDGEVILWDHASGQSLCPLLSPPGEVAEVALGPKGRLAATRSQANGGSQILVWNLASCTLATEQPKSSGPEATSLAFSPSGAALAIGHADGTISSWDISTGQLSQPRLAQASEVRCLAFSPDGQILASAHDDWSIRLWDSATGGLIGRPLVGHTEYIGGLVFSPDGALLVSSTIYDVAIIWDVAARRPLGQPLAGLGGSGVHAAFTPDGKQLALLYDNGLILRSVDPSAWIERACYIANRNLNQDEWDQFIGSDVPYQCTCADLPPGKGAPEDACE